MAGCPLGQSWQLFILTQVGIFDFLTAGSGRGNGGKAKPVSVDEVGFKICGVFLS